MRVEPTAYEMKFDKALVMSTLLFFLKWTLGSITTLTLICPACAHSELDRPRLNVIPGKACGLQTEMRYLDALGKYGLIFIYSFKAQSHSNTYKYYQMNILN